MIGTQAVSSGAYSIKTVALAFSYMAFSQPASQPLSLSFNARMNLFATNNATQMLTRKIFWC